MNKTFPKITIAITSCNRFYYLKSLITSLKQFSLYPNLEWIIVDNGSTEPGLIEYLKSLYFLNKLILNKKRTPIIEEYIARNQILKNSTGEYIWWIQDDCQLILPGAHLESSMLAFKQNPELIQIFYEAVRRKTVENKYKDSIQKNINGTRFLFTENTHFHTLGISRMSTFKKIGLYKENIYSWGAGEDDYSKRIREHFPRYFQAYPHIPSICTINNEPNGSYAFIRGNYRYGHYIPPQKGILYFDTLTKEEIGNLNKIDKSPMSIVDIAKPINWELKINSDGDEIKYSQKEAVKKWPKTKLNSKFTLLGKITNIPLYSYIARQF